MKTAYNKLTGILLILSLFMANIQLTSAQDQEFKISKYRMMYKFQTKKQVDNSRLLEVSFLARNKKDRKDRLPITQANIQFYNVLEDEEILLGEVKTDNKGIAQLIVSKDQTYLKDEEGYIELEAKFAKTEALKRQSKSLKVKDLFIDLELKEVDSVNTVFVTTYELDSTGQRIMANGVEVELSVGGMISRMPIEKSKTKKGKFDFEFPTDIRGDVNGDFELFAFVDDNDDYGSIVQSTKSDWGVFDDIQEPEKNKLWTDAAPIWMYVILTFLLVGVWASFIHTIYNLFKIKKLGTIN